MAAVKTPRPRKVASAAKPKKQPKRAGSNRSGRKYLSREMLNTLIQMSPPHPAAESVESNNPPFDPQED